MCVVVNEYMNIYINNNINDMSCIYILKTDTQIFAKNIPRKNISGELSERR